MNNNNKRKEKKKNTKNILKNVARLNKNVGNIMTAKGIITVLSMSGYESIAQTGVTYPNPNA